MKAAARLPCPKLSIATASMRLTGCSAQEHRREVHHKRFRKPAMVAPNLLQPRAEIDDVSESGPSPPFAEGHERFHQRFEGAEI
jgi:hypothetical protein